MQPMILAWYSAWQDYWQKTLWSAALNLLCGPASAVAQRPFALSAVVSEVPSVDALAAFAIAVAGALLAVAVSELVSVVGLALWELDAGAETGPARASLGAVLSLVCVVVEQVETSCVVLLVGALSTLLAVKLAVI